MKHIFISLLVVIFTFTLKAQQDTPFDKKLFKEQKDAFKEAEDYLKQGNELFNVISPEYLDENSSDRKSTRLNSSHVKISYAVFCLKKKKKIRKYNKS